MFNFIVKLEEESSIWRVEKKLTEMMMMKLKMKRDQGNKEREWLKNLRLLSRVLRK